MLKTKNKGIGERFGDLFFETKEQLSSLFSKDTVKSLQTWFGALPKERVRIGMWLAVGLMVFSEIATLTQPLFTQHSYDMGDAASLLSQKNDQYKKHITFDQAKQAYQFEYGANTSPGLTHANVGTVAATVAKDPTKGVVVSDSMNKVDFTMKPKFKVMEGRQDGNRIIYPLSDGSGWLVYTLQAVGVKEDVVLSFAKGDTMSLEYELGLGDSMEARMQPDGSVSVYGNKLFSGNISASSEKDAALLAKARQNAPKDSFLFSIPRPVINDKQGVSSNVTASYELHGTSLKVNVKGLKTGSYPLTIDPSIYVVTAYQFMYGNNETNINFDVDNKMIRKGRLTGARFDSWQNTANLPIGSWGSGSVASGGYIYQVGGASFSGQVFSTQGASTYTVPSGVTSMTVKMWGGGGGGGETGGGDGGGAGYVEGTISPVFSGETFAVYIGGGGGAGNNNAGGGGGAFTNLTRNTGTVRLLTAAGGGGGGAQDATSDGGGGGNVGNTIAGNGVAASGTNGGGGGTQSAGGAAGTATCNGQAGASLAGGNGASAILSICNTNGGGGAAGTNTGGGGGAAGTTALLGTFFGGGGGGGGFFGGGGGGSSTTRGGGGGGGSSYINTGVVTSGATQPGSGTVPGNNTDLYRGNAGNGGAAGSAGATGLMVISTNAAGNPATKSLNWAKFDTGNGTVVNADPGNGACSGWCSTSTYDMPTNRSNFSLVAYNGYLYAMGGNDENGTGSANRKNTIYVAKLGANGEPRLWSPTSSDPSTWTYWHTNSNTLPSVRINAGAVAYNNKMYFVGGLDSTGTVSTVSVANILPTGQLGTWSSSTALSSGGPGAIYGMNLLVYNDHLYTVGGNATLGGTPIASVYYIKINSDGTLASSWIQTNGFTTGRINMGGTNAAVWGGYLYIVGGCSVVNASGICTTVLGDTQIASINADGSLSAFTTVSGLTESRMGFGMLTWRDNLYVVGGCTSQDASSGSCLGGIQAGIDYGHINLSGDVSSIATSVASGTAPCSGGTPTNCNLPGTGNIGNLLDSAIVANGYLYVAGGCSGVVCGSTSNGVVFTTVSSSGDLVRPATCPTGSTATNGWCVMDTNMPVSVASAAPVVFNDTLYLVGGFTGGTSLAGNIKHASLNSSTGLVGAWSTDTLTTIGATSVAHAYAAARANPASASSSPGNLYIFGGCTTVSNSSCSAYTDAVYKCNIGTSGAVTGCSTLNQVQIGTPSEATGAGMAMAGGTVYANYIYLIGGTATGAAEMAKVRYAKFDNSNNVVDADGETIIDNAWTESPAGQTMAVSRRNATSFGYNGHLYVVGGYDTTTGFRGDIIFIKLSTTDGSLSTEGWQTSNTSVTARWGAAAAMGGSHVITIGGCTVGNAPACSTMSPTIQRFQVYNNSSGGPVAYTAQGSGIGVDRVGGSATILNGYIYYAGGCSAMNCTAVTNTNYYAPIGADGVIGTWTQATSNLPNSLAWGKLLAAGGTLYYVGGQTTSAESSSVTTVYYTSGISAGVPTWNGAAATMGIGDTGTGAQPRTKFGAAVWNDRIYVVGGYSNNPTVQNTVYVSPKQTSGGNITGNWKSTTVFNVARGDLSVVAYANNLYLLGGYDSTNYLSDVQFSKIDVSGGGTDGEVGSWSYAANLPGAIADADAFAANGYIYLVGGRSASSACTPSTLFAPVTANTDSDTPTGIGNWQETRAQYTGDRYGAAAVYNDGKAYVIGGGCSSFVNSSTERNFYTAVLSQPQVAKYSISFDTDTDIFPSNWLANGYNSYSGAKWNAKYRSMSDPTVNNTNNVSGPGRDCSAAPMSDWGLETSQPDVTLGKINPAYTYTPLDGSGANTNCARYFYFSLTADNTQALSFPENVNATTGPSITDLTLRFTASPSKRLMHGRTFIGGIQQPDDTPYYTY